MRPSFWPTPAAIWTKRCGWRKTALARIPGQPSFSDTIGYIYLKKGMLDSAIQSFSTLAHRYPDVRQLPLPLGTGVVPERREGRARKELEAALAESSLAARDFANPGVAQ